jgi:putative tricarboxylic transport membrane protein
MDLLSSLAAGLGAAAAPANLLCLVAGCVLGMLTGVLPGIRCVTAIAVLMPLAYVLAPGALLILLAAIAYGAVYGGAVAALVSEQRDGTPMPADGFQLARQGRAGAAIGVASAALCIGAAAGTWALAASAAPLAELSFQFGPAEYFSLMVLGLAGAAVLARGSLVKAIAMTVLGLLLGVFAHVSLAHPVLGMQAPADGAMFVVLAIGLYGLGGISGLLARPAGAREELPVGERRGSRAARGDFEHVLPPLLRGTAVGCLVGVLPGGGRLLAAYVAYSIERAMALRAGEVPFGKGNLRGVAAPAAAQGAGAQTMFVPLLALGIPTSGVTALLMGALAIGHVPAGPQLMAGSPQLFWGLIASMWIGNLVLAALSFSLAPLWVRARAVPRRMVVPALVVLCSLGIYLVHRDAAEVGLAAGIAVAAYVLAQLGCEPMPLLLGFILGPAMEDSLREAMLLADGDWGTFATRPFSAGLLSAALLLVLLVALPAVKLRRERAFAPE